MSEKEQSNRQEYRRPSACFAQYQREGKFQNSYRQRLLCPVPVADSARLPQPFAHAVVIARYRPESPRARRSAAIRVTRLKRPSSRVRHRSSRGRSALLTESLSECKNTLTKRVPQKERTIAEYIKKSERHKYHKRILRFCRTMGAFGRRPIRSPSPKSIRVYIKLPSPIKRREFTHTLPALPTPFHVGCHSVNARPQSPVNAVNTPFNRIRCRSNRGNTMPPIACTFRSPRHCRRYGAFIRPFNPAKIRGGAITPPQKNPKTEPTVFRASPKLRAPRTGANPP